MKIKSTYKNDGSISSRIVKAFKTFLTVGAFAAALTASASLMADEKTYTANDNATMASEYKQAVDDTTSSDITVATDIVFNISGTVDKDYNDAPNTGSYWRFGTANYAGANGYKSLTIQGDGTIDLTDASVARRFFWIENVNDADIKFEGLTLTGGGLDTTTGNSGSAILISSVKQLGNVDFANLEISNNNSAYGGGHSSGAIYIDGTNSSGNSSGIITFDNVNIKYNVCSADTAATTNQGAGARIMNFETLTVKNSLIQGNEASLGGAGTVLAGGGLEISNSQDSTATFSNVTFDANKVTNTSTAASSAGGGAIDLYNVTGGYLSATFDKGTVFSNNKAILDSNVDGSSAQGGAVILRALVDAKFDGVTFSDNTSESLNKGDAAGGAIHVGKEGAGKSKLAFSNTTFSGNEVGSNAWARGGAIFIANDATEDITFTDTSFDGNKALGNTESRGGAISIGTGVDITIQSAKGDVTFSGNVAGNGSNTGTSRGNSIYSGSNVNFNAGAGTMIADLDGHYVTGTVTVNGDTNAKGRVEFVSQVQSLAGAYVINGQFASVVNGDVSSFKADSTLGGAGTVTVNEGATWYLDLTNADPNAPIMVSSDGWNGSEANAQAALEKGGTLVELNVITGGDYGAYIGFGPMLAQANMSDIYLSSAMMHRWNTVRNATNDRIDLNYAANHARKASGCDVGCGTKFFDSNSVWANYVGRTTDLESSFFGSDFDITSNGVQAGIDLYSNNLTQFGIMFGYEDIESEKWLDSVEADDMYVGLYGSHILSNKLDIRAMFGYGWQDYDISRFGMGNTYNKFSADGKTYEANIELGRRFGSNCGFSYRPFVGLDYFKNDIDGGYDGEFSYGGIDFEQLFLRVGTDLRYTRNRLTLNGGIAYSYQMLSDGDRITSGVSQGAFSNTLRGCDLGNSVLSINAGANYYLNSQKTLSVFAGYIGDAFLDRDGTPFSHSGTLGLSYRF